MNYKQVIQEAARRIEQSDISRLREEMVKHTFTYWIGRRLHSKDYRVWEAQQFLTTVGLGRHLLPEVVIFPYPDSVIKATVPATVLMGVIWEGLQLLNPVREEDRTYLRHMEVLTAGSGREYLLMDLEETMEPEEIERFRLNYFFAPIAVRRSPFFKMLSMTPMFDVNSLSLCD